MPEMCEKRSQSSLILHLFRRGNVQSPKKGYTPLDFLIYVLVCTAQTIKSMKTNDMPLESPIKLQQEMQKKNFDFSKICKIFRAFFEKAVFFENGHGSH